MGRWRSGSLAFSRSKSSWRRTSTGTGWPWSCPLDDAGGGPALEAFFGDADKSFRFIVHRPVEIPFDIAERFVPEARDRLPTTKFECPVCGAAELNHAPYANWPPPEGTRLEPPYEEVLGMPSYEVCPNCGYEFGNDDNPGTASGVSFADYRDEWNAEGSPRFDRRNV